MAIRDHVGVIRFAFVVFHVAVVTILSLPAPTGARKESVWTDPHVRRELAGWAGMLRGLGIDVEADEMVSTARAAALGVLDVRDLVVAPLQPYARLTGAQQGWQMFATLNEEPARLCVRIQYRPGGAWEPLYVAREPEHAWRIAQLDQERARAFMNDWSWGRDRADYRAFARWLADRAAEDFPDAHALQVSMLRARLPTPEQIRAGKAPPERPTWVEELELKPQREDESP